MDFSGTGTRVVTDRQIALPGSVAAIGAFDGVHRGHQHLIRAAIRDARARGVPSVVWTFDPPPKVFFGRARQLVALDQKLARIGLLGPDWIVVAPFHAAYARRSAEAFLAWDGSRRAASMSAPISALARGSRAMSPCWPGISTWRWPAPSAARAGRRSRPRASAC